MKKTLSILSIAIACSIYLMSCSSEFPGFDKTDNGLYYKFITKEAKEPIPVGDYSIIDMTYKLNDTLMLFDSRKIEEPLKLLVRNPLYKGDINEAFAIMGVGDSARFIVPSDSFFIRNIGLEKLPDMIPKGSLIYFDIKVKGIQSKADFEKERQEMLEKKKQMIEEMNKKEAEDIAAWIEKNKIKAKPTESGLYFIEIKKGKGKKVEAGKTVTVNYTGRLLDGQIFDTSIEEVAKANNLYMVERKYEPFQFQVGMKQVIAGWDEGLQMMSEGGKARLIIPSALGYRDRGVQDIIPPFATLDFEVEVIKVE